MNEENPAKKKWTKEEVIAAIQECAAKLGRTPTQPEMKEACGVNPRLYMRLFGNFTKALEASGFEGRGAGYATRMRELFMEWATMVRAMGQVPSLCEYELRSKFSVAPLRTRFGKWSHVTKGMVQYAVENNLSEEWADVLEIAKQHEPHLKKERSSFRLISISTSKPRLLNDRPLYGAPFMGRPMAFAPVNEMGVVYLFGTLAEKLGFIVTWIGTQYPDAEAFREVEPERWQRVRVEFEFQSRNFLQHFHDPDGCDLIVCWENNWEECPLEVLELKPVVEGAETKRQVSREL